MPTPPSSEDEKTLRDLHTLLLQTEVMEGKLVCGNCGHEYKIKEGIANFLLPSHLGEFPCGVAVGRSLWSAYGGPQENGNG